MARETHGTIEGASAERVEMQDGDADIRFTSESDGRSTRVELIAGGRSVSRCWVVSQRIRVGAAVVRMDGIGGVGTDESERMKGYAARVLRAAMRRMLAGDASLTMLYGIPDFYTRFGYTPAGPEHLIRVPAADCALRNGWTFRPLRPNDLPQMHRLYASLTAAAVGPAIRTETCYAHRKLREAAATSREEPRYDDLCRVVVGPDGRLCGYAWRGNGFWATEIMEREAPDCLVISESLAASPEAADGVLAVCRRWAWETGNATGRAVAHALVSGPHDSPVAAAAMRTDAMLVRRYTRCGGSMARILSLPRLMEALVPELHQRLRASGIRLTRPFTIRLASGDAVTIHRSAGTLAVDAVDDCPADETETLMIPDSEMARAVLGAVDPCDLLERIHPLPSPRVRRVFAAMFPLKCPHMYLPDRY